MDKEIEVTQLLTYKLDPNVVQADTNKPATMKQTMGLLQGKAEAQLSILTDTRAALAQKIQELDAATNKIASLEADIVRLEGEKKQLQDNVTVLEKEVAERKAKIEELNASLEEATGKITDLQADVAKLKDTILDQSDKIKTQEDTIKRLMEKLNPTGPATGGSSTNGTSSLTSGTKGQILLVNKDYNFVVISLSAPAGIGVAQELTVQRGDKLVGKVRITEVSGQYPIAIADQLLAPWKQADAEVGDYVFH
jgi:predicted RNase H-like nuclease (RuvC/YqgF family)